MGDHGYPQLLIPCSFSYRLSFRYSFRLHLFPQPGQVGDQLAATNSFAFNMYCISDWPSPIFSLYVQEKVSTLLFSVWSFLVLILSIRDIFLYFFFKTSFTTLSVHGILSILLYNQISSSSLRNLSIMYSHIGWLILHIISARFSLFLAKCFRFLALFITFGMRILLFQWTSFVVIFFILC